MTKDIANIVQFLVNNPNYVLIFLVCDPRGNGLEIFREVSGTPQSCVTACLGAEGLAATLYVLPPDASTSEARRLVHHSDPKALHDLICAIVDGLETFGYPMSKDSVPRDQVLRSGQARYLGFVDGCLEIALK